MKKYLNLFSASALTLLLTACETLNSGSGGSQYASQNIVNLQYEVAALKRQVTTLSRNQDAAAREISSIQNQLTYVNEQNQLQNKSLNALNEALNSERAQRREAMDKVVETVADQTAKTVNSIARQTPAPTSSNASTGLQAGAYYKHKVESGQTLIAIARAYKVSVSDIKQANNLSSDIIRVGQILHIPKK
ncbi:MAG: LysM peptidoglycan-binding domain-containing protein [Victivallales bacterium]|nr:LysM peptidoglycan-binding domain-containing protein [Victivallales bacterium]